jgi:predicted TIM-barrel fold metal-dependent hydrolase
MYMKIICVEEHTVDTEIAKAALPSLLEEAPYMALQSSADSEPRNGRRPARVSMKDAVVLGADLGDGRIKEMDAQGIQMQIVSYTSPIHLVPVDRAVTMARAANDRVARASAANPDRLGGFAVLPWQHPEAAADELSRAVHELGFKGALLLGRPGKTFLDDPRYLPVLEKLAELKVPIYLHPFNPTPQVNEQYYSGLAPEVSAEFALAGWGWHHEAGIHVLRLLLSGIFEKLPDLQLISGHWGEMVPFFLARLDFVIPPRATGFARTISQIYKDHVWVTPSGMFDLPHFEFIAKEIGADRILWSTDYPYLTMDGAREFLLNLPVSEEDKQKMAYRNAEKLFRL